MIDILFLKVSMLFQEDKLLQGHQIFLNQQEFLTYLYSNQLVKYSQ